MRFHFFTVDALAPAAGANELNAFCAQHRVAAVDKQFIAQGAHSYWLFCLTTVEADGAERAAAGGGKRARIDYREVLSEGDFAVYAELRELRKTIAEHDGLPIYALFTNEQLAEMVTVRATISRKANVQINRRQAAATRYGARCTPLSAERLPKRRLQGGVPCPLAIPAKSSFPTPFRSPGRVTGARTTNTVCGWP